MPITIPPADPHRSSLYWGPDGLAAAQASGRPVINLGPGDASAVLDLAEVEPDAGRAVYLQRLSAAGVAAWARLTGALPPRTWPRYRLQFTELACLDAGQLPRWITGADYPRAVSDSPLWGPLALYCLNVQELQRLSPGYWGSNTADLLAEMWCALTGAASGARDQWRLGAANVRDWVASDGIQVRDGVALAVDPPQGGGLWSALYERARVGVIVTAAPGGIRHYSVGYDPHVKGGAPFTAAIRASLSALEPGWGGPPGAITGSPKPGGSQLAPDQVIAACATALATLGP